MPPFWNQVFLDNPIRKYVWVGLAILLGILFKRAISRFTAGVLYRLIRKWGSGLEKASFVNLVVAPLETFLMVLVVLVSVEKLHYPDSLRFDIYEISMQHILQGIARLFLISAFVWLLLRIVDFVAMILEWKAESTPGVTDNHLVTFLRDFLKIILGVLGLLLILSRVFGIQVQNLWTGLGIAGAALALATKESIENLIASFILFFDKPFRVGDLLKVGSVTGTVEKIGLRSTRIRTEIKTFVTVPNKQMVDSVVDNLSLRTQRKAELRLSLSLSTRQEALEEFLQQARRLLDRDRVLQSFVFLTEFGPGGYLVSIDYFTTPMSWREFNQVRESVNIDLLQMLRRLDIPLAGARMQVELMHPPK